MLIKKEKPYDWSASILLALSVCFKRENTRHNIKFLSIQSLIRVKKRRSGKHGCSRSSL
jgi:hypothetical protein